MVEKEKMVRGIKKKQRRRSVEPHHHITVTTLHHSSDIPAPFHHLQSHRISSHTTDNPFLSITPLQPFSETRNHPVAFPFLAPFSSSRTDPLLTSILLHSPPTLFTHSRLPPRTHDPQPFIGKKPPRTKTVILTLATTIRPPFIPHSGAHYLKKKKQNRE
ncbi:hypothetical protein V8G54_037035 [Vigna mungo]|uniref:Uncharacterized protein n=1 Tax=Vigna mungo TaxID=3915 RepID=A0AAQ3MIE5_VIGMU